MKQIVFLVAMIFTISAQAKDMAVFFGDSLTSGFIKKTSCQYPSELDYYNYYANDGDPLTNYKYEDIGNPVCTDSWYAWVKTALRNKLDTYNFSVPALSARNVITLAKQGDQPKPSPYPGRLNMVYPGTQAIVGTANKPEYASGHRILVLALGVNDLLISYDPLTSFMKFLGTCVADDDYTEISNNLIAMARGAREFGFTEVYWVKFTPGYYTSSNGLLVNTAAYLSLFNERVGFCLRSVDTVMTYADEVAKQLLRSGQFNGIINITPPDWLDYGYNTELQVVEGGLHYTPQANQTLAHIFLDAVRSPSGQGVKRILMLKPSE